MVFVSISPESHFLLSHCFLFMKSHHGLLLQQVVSWHHQFYSPLTQAQNVLSPASPGPRCSLSLDYSPPTPMCPPSPSSLLGPRLKYHFCQGSFPLLLGLGMSPTLALHLSYCSSYLMTSCLSSPLYISNEQGKCLFNSNP